MTSTIPPSSSKTTAALTTVFTPPLSCLQRTYTLSGKTGSFTDLTDKGSDGSTLTIHRGYSTECFPPEATLSDGWVQFSPGICPSAYSIASMWSDGIGFTETFATCCPWYMHASTAYYDCGSYPESTRVVLSGVGADGSSVTTTAGYAFDTPIFIAWQSSDLSRLERHPTETGSWNIATDIQAPMMTSGNGSVIPSSTLQPVAAEEKSSGMSAGAKAGVGVGVSLGVLLVIAIVGFALWRRRRAKKSQLATHGDPQEHTEMSAGGREVFHQIDSTGEIYETSAEEKKPKVWAEVEGDTRKVSELDAQAGSHSHDRMPGGHTAELEGDGPMQRRY
ncbi:unnamed protein product [Cercospora beticola]|nr:unnamed protein product [Cercospora beticola]